jgi:hypothetical protein
MHRFLWSRLLRGHGPDRARVREFDGLGSSNCEHRLDSSSCEHGLASSTENLACDVIICVSGWACGSLCNISQCVIAMYIIDIYWCIFIDPSLSSQFNCCTRLEFKLEQLQTPHTHPYTSDNSGANVAFVVAVVVVAGIMLAVRRHGLVVHCTSRTQHAAACMIKQLAGWFVARCSIDCTSLCMCRTTLISYCLVSVIDVVVGWASQVYIHTVSILVFLEKHNDDVVGRAVARCSSRFLTLLVLLV